MRRSLIASVTQIIDDQIEFCRSLRPKAGIRQPGLICCGSAIQLPQILRDCSEPCPRPASAGSSDASGREHNVPRAGVPRTRWQLTHDCARNAACAFAGIAAASVDGRLRFVLQPALELGRRVDDHAQQHVGVLRAAILGALAENKPGLSVWNHMWFGRPGIRSVLPARRGTQKLWQTSADLKRQIDRPMRRRRSLAGTCSSLAVMKPSLLAVVVIVDVFPPPLVADDRDEQRLVARLRLGQRSSSTSHSVRVDDQHQDEDDQSRRRGPGDLDRLAAVDLRRLGRVGRTRGGGSGPSSRAAPLRRRGR